MKDHSEGNTKSREPLYQHWPFMVYGYYKPFFLLSDHSFKRRLLSFLNSDYDDVFRHLLTTCKIRKPQHSLQGFARLCKGSGVRGGGFFSVTAVTVTVTLLPNPGHLFGLEHILPKSSVIKFCFTYSFSKSLKGLLENLVCHHPEASTSLDTNIIVLLALK